MGSNEYRPTIAQLRTFATIAEFGHFGTAASHMGISQPSLSQALAALENGLGVQLIERSTRKVIVTSIGRSLLPYAQATLESLETFVSHAQGAQGGLVGTAAIGMIPTVAPFILPDLLSLLPGAAPDLQPRIIEEKTPHLMEALRQGRIDLALVGLPLEEPGVETLPLYEEEFVMVLPPQHPLAGKTNLTLDHLNQVELLLLDEGHCLRDQVLQLCKNVDMRNDPRMSLTRATSLTTVIQLVAAGHGATLAPISALAGQCYGDKIGLARFRGGVKTAGREIGLAYRNSSTRLDDFNALGAVITEAFTRSAENSREEIGAYLPVR